MTSWVPIDDVDLACLHPRDELGRLGGRPDRVGGDDRGARVGKERGDLVGDPLDARAAGDQAVLLLALRAGLGRRHHMAAMMAGEAAGEAVLDHPGGAVRALEAVAAAPAEGERRIAAAVEEEQALLARRQSLAPAPRPAAAPASGRAAGGSCSRSSAAMSGSWAPP